MIILPAPLKSLYNRLRWSRLPTAAVGVNVVRYDKQCPKLRSAMKYPYLWRFYDPKSKNPGAHGLPHSVRINGGRGHVRLNQQWIFFLAEINTSKAVHYIARPDSGWRNKGDINTFEQVTWGAAFVVVTHISGRKALIQSYDNSKYPEDYPIDYNQLFTVGYPDDTNSGPPCGPCYTFLISNPGEQLWMDIDDLYFYRSYP